MGSTLSGRDFGQDGKARPLHACLRKVDGGTAKIELERLGRPKRNCGREDSASERASGDSRWTMVRWGQRTEGCKRYGTVDRNGGDIMIY